MLLIFNAAGPDLQLRAARRYAERIAGMMAPLRARPPAGGRERLRIGYLSADLYNHATAHLLAGVIERHDRERFEIIGDFSPPVEDDPYRGRLEEAFDEIRPLRASSDQEAAQCIADDHVDIAVDLKGWTRGHRGAVLAPRPASLQLQWFGYPGTLGAPWIDYVIADEVIAPPGSERDFSEKVILLPRCYQPNDDRRPVGPAVDRRACGLPDTGFVFCSFNQIIKLSAEIFDL
jgi:predicted O-linked N-acetylglucosamine transferase (SPINDLY family)